HPRDHRGGERLSRSPFLRAGSLRCVHRRETMRGTASRIRFGVAAGAVIVAAVAGALFDGDAARPSGTVTISIVAAIAGAIALAVAATGSRAKRVVAAI